MTSSLMLEAAIQDRFWAKVDLLSSPTGCWLWTAATIGSNHGDKRYGAFSSGGVFKSRLAHRISWEMGNGPIPARLQIDHRHTCPKTCVNPVHLRLATNKQNNENQAGPRRDNKSSGVRGVTWDKRRRLWKASVMHNGKQCYAGAYSSIEAAAEAARLKRLELFTHSDGDAIFSKKHIG